MLASALLALAGLAQAASCPSEMANIGDGYCIDKWEDTIVDKNTGESVSPYYTPDIRKDWPGARWQYRVWASKPSYKGYALPTPVPIQITENFVPKAVSMPDVYPQGFMNKKTAAEACSNAGKRLCTRMEWYKACVGPAAPIPVTGPFFVAFPYGSTYQPGKCNYHLSSVDNLTAVGRSNAELDDPRLGTVVDGGTRILKRTGEMTQCTNGYGVFDMVGNQDEVVDGGSGGMMVFVGSFYNRGESNGPQGCAASISAHHASQYYDYSIGFRCCADIQE